MVLMMRLATYVADDPTAVTAKTTSSGLCFLILATLVRHIVRLASSTSNSW